MRCQDRFSCGGSPPDLRCVYVLVLGLVFASGCSTADPEITLTLSSPVVQPTDVVVDVRDLHQEIDGFGASSAWTAPGLSDALSDLFFSEELGIGLSLLRLRIAPDGTTAERTTALQAHARGAAVWAAPWSPPGAWKTSGTDEFGGSLLPEHYQDWADRLALFVKTTEGAGVPLLAVSAQNEPNWVAEWETCEWTPEELSLFVRDYLTPTLRREGLETKVLAPETSDWVDIDTYGDLLLADAETRAAVDIIAVHSYGGFAFDYPLPAAYGKRFWQTEVSDGEARDDGMGSALRYARMIHDHLSIANVNAWHYWWLLPRFTQSEANGSLVNGGVLTRRAYALGNFSKFVRPQAFRVRAQPANPQSGVYVTAFHHALSGRIVVVAINTGGAIRQRFWIDGMHVSEMTPWTTSESDALVAKTPIFVADHFDHVLPAYSITSFVGVSGEPPSPGEGGNGGATAPDLAGASSVPIAGGAENENDVGPDSGGFRQDDDRHEFPETPHVSCLCNMTSPIPARRGSPEVAAWVVVTLWWRRRARCGETRSPAR